MFDKWYHYIVLALVLVPVFYGHEHLQEIDPVWNDLALRLLFTFVVGIFGSYYMWQAIKNLNAMTFPDNPQAARNRNLIVAILAVIWLAMIASVVRLWMAP